MRYPGFKNWLKALNINDSLFTPYSNSVTNQMGKMNTPIFKSKAIHLRTEYMKKYI